MGLFRIWNLILLQLGNKFKFKDRKKETILNIALSFASFLLVTVLYVVALEVFKKFFYIEVNDNFFASVVLIIQLLNIIATTTNMLKGFYSSKDNPILLALPAQADEVFTSKMAVCYIKDLRNNLFSTITLFIAYGLIASNGLYYYFATLICIFLLPLITVLICSLITIPLMYILKIFKKVPILVVLIGIGSLVLITLLINKAEVSVNSIFGDTIRLKGMYNAIVMYINKAIVFLSSHSLHIKWIKTFLMINKEYYQGQSIDLLYLLLLVLITLISNILLSKPLFFRLSSSSLERASTKKHKASKTKDQSTFKAFFKKENIITFRNISSILSDYALIIALPFFLYFINIFFKRLSLNYIGSSATLSIYIIIALMLIASSCSSTSVALSKEGAEFVLLKTSPAETNKICWAKLFTNFIITTIFILLSTILMAILKVTTIKQLLLIFIIFELCNFANILKSIEIDLNNPLMHEFEVGAPKGTNNETKALTSGIILAFICGLLNLVIAILYNPKVLTYDVASLLILIALLVIYVIYRLYFFYLTLKTKFERIEY